MRGRGFKPHTERMLNTGNGLQLLNMERQEPTLPAPDCNQSEWILRSTAHVCDSNWRGVVNDRVYRMPALPTQGTGQTIYY